MKVKILLLTPVLNKNKHHLLFILSSLEMILKIHHKNLKKKKFKSTSLRKRKRERERAIMEGRGSRDETLSALRE